MKYFIIWLVSVSFYMTLFKAAAREDKELDRLWRKKNMDIGDAIKEQLELNKNMEKKKKRK